MDVSTRQKVVYVAPNEVVNDCFEYFNTKYPMHFDGTAPIVEGIDAENVFATITLPYTHQDTVDFASIHSNPPGISTEIPAMAITRYGKGTVIWSGLAVEGVENHDYRRVLMNLLDMFFVLERTIKSDAPDDVEVTGFRTEEAFYVNTVLLNEKYKARKVEPFSVEVRCESLPMAVIRIPEEKPVNFRYEEGYIAFDVADMKIFDMYKIILA